MAVVSETTRGLPTLPTKPPFFSDRDTVASLLEQCAEALPEHVVLRVAAGLTYAQLNRAVNRAAHGLAVLGIRKGDHVAVMLRHAVDHVVTFFALMKLGAVQLPINVHMRGDGLAYILEHGTPRFMIAEAAFGDVLSDAIAAKPDLQMIWREESQTDGLAKIYAHPDDSNLSVALSDADVRGILYTSGTTGAPKGVVMTDRMYRAAALGSIWIGDIVPGSVLHFWDPIYHVFGSEVLVLSLMVPVTLLMVPRFSATRLWDEARTGGATHIHFVGGVLQLLLKQPPSPHDRTHGVRVAWGGGCPVEIWPAFEERFGVRIREGYGMTETSSFSVINIEGHPGSIGRAVAYFDVEVVDGTGRSAASGEPGEIRVRAREPGVLVAAYHRDTDATAAAIRDGWLYTGDIGHADAEGRFFFHGRKKDSLRRRGENISAWEVEGVVVKHPLVEECALVGVKNEFGDEDLKLFVKPRSPELTATTLLAWCAPRMAAFQVPRFVAFVDEFRKTPTQRIQKQFLSRSLDDCWDGEAERGVHR
jgi:carnitine-CoA ligase